MKEKNIQGLYLAQQINLQQFRSRFIIYLILFFISVLILILVSYSMPGVVAHLNSDFIGLIFLGLIPGFIVYLFVWVFWSVYNRKLLWNIYFKLLVSVLLFILGFLSYFAGIKYGEYTDNLYANYFLKYPSLISIENNKFPYETNLFEKNTVLLHMSQKTTNESQAQESYYIWDNKTNKLIERNLLKNSEIIFSNDYHTFAMLQPLKEESQKIYICQDSTDDCKVINKTAGDNRYMTNTRISSDGQTLSFLLTPSKYTMTPRYKQYGIVDLSKQNIVYITFGITKRIN
jgi:hypothetical protein